MESCSFLNAMNMAKDLRTEWVPTELRGIPNFSGPVISTTFFNVLVIADDVIQMFYLYQIGDKC